MGNWKHSTTNNAVSGELFGKRQFLVTKVPQKEHKFVENVKSFQFRIIFMIRHEKMLMSQ